MSTLWPRCRCSHAPGQCEASHDFGTVVDNLDRRKVTRLHAQDYCKSIRGESVTWSGHAYDVKGGRTRARIYAAEPSRPVHHGYNIVVTTDDMSRAAGVKKGRRSRFNAELLK